jgi:hypothetical protein
MNAEGKSPRPAALEEAIAARQYSFVQHGLPGHYRFAQNT